MGVALDIHRHHIIDLRKYFAVPKIFHIFAVIFLQYFMHFKLETPPHQTTAIQSIVGIFEGMERNTFDNSHFEDVHANTCSLKLEEIANNIHTIATNNGLSPDDAHFEDVPDVCIEMETGTGGIRIER